MKFAELKQINQAHTLLTVALDLIDARAKGEAIPEKADTLIETAIDVLKNVMANTETDDV